MNPTTRTPSQRARSRAIAFAILAFALAPSAHAEDEEKPMPEEPPAESPQPSEDRLHTATFGNGCFWCTEAVFRELEGVDSVTSGYSGGTPEDADYKRVSTGLTKHAEVLQIRYDPEVVSYKALLEVFWKTHDPTTLNRQGNDHGPQYRSVIFTHDDEQKELAETYKKRLDESGAFDDPIVTAVEPFEAFYPAEAYHQDFYLRNPDHPYCRAVILPKIEKFQKAFADRLKDSSEAGEASSAGR